ncbi:hypothetical protein [Thermocoleostomius sinensis]|uniref:Uncharacterized protein n=1 Tax=Thermocoleostomius sinensis A174 TaxID=2016057 RepID=A0A9E8ZBZ8_9CYAN|nr:hypothetical protein [Thermocoleostomius sinensis]WAL60051.1 hypothetical protein OXH18_23235 [Thermocoleostomius sinensis A174]
MSFLIFLLLGIAILWLGRKATDDIPVIAVSLSSIILLIWSFAIAPASVQLLVELPLVGIAFSLCVQCCRCEDGSLPRSSARLDR